MRAGVYERLIFPWLNEAASRVPAVQRMRRDVLQAAAGRVVEIGFGSGANLAYYPAAVASVTGVEPNPGMLDRAVSRLAGSPVPARVICAVAERLPFPDGTFDAAVSTLTLCSVADPERVLAELRRVLRASGVLFVLEHGLTPAPGVARWQHRLNGLERVLACGCNLDRPIASLVTRAGFSFRDVSEAFAPGVPRTHGWFTVGDAVKDSA